MLGFSGKSNHEVHIAYDKNCRNTISVSVFGAEVEGRENVECFRNMD